MTEITLGFHEGVADQLAYYVYLLADPRDQNQVFYVGKGKGERVFAHVRAVRAKLSSVGFAGFPNPKTKDGRIAKLIVDGVGVEHIILRHGLTHAEAEMVEATVIDVLRLSGFRLTNIVRGAHSTVQGSATVAELNARLGATHEVTFDRPTVLYRLNEWDHSWTDEKAFERVRRSWPAGDSARERLEVACAVSGYVIQEVYLIDPKGWKLVDPVKKKWEFDRLPIPEGHPAMQLKRGSVRRLFVVKEEDGGEHDKSFVRMLYRGFTGDDN